MRLAKQHSSHLVTVSSRLFVFTLVSRILGLLRDMAIAWCVGSGVLGDLLAQALRLPHIFRRLLGEGLFSLHLTTAFVQCEAPHSLYRSLVRRCALLFFLTSLLIACSAPWIARLFTLGDSLPLLASLVRIVAWYFGFVGMAALAMSFLQAYQIFWVSATAPLLFNAVLLLALACASFFYASGATELIFLVASAFSLGGLVQWLWHAYFLKKLCPPPSMATKDLSHLAGSLLRRQPLGLFAVAAHHLLLLLSMAALSRWGEGYVAALFYAERLLEFPLGLVAVCLSMASLPALAQSAKEKRHTRFRRMLAVAVYWTIFFVFPCIAGLLAIGEPLIRLLFCHGNFDLLGAERTWFVLQTLLPFLLAAAVNRVVVPACIAENGLSFVAIATLLALALAGILFGFGMFPTHAASTALFVHTLLLVVWLKHRIGMSLCVSWRFCARLAFATVSTYVFARAGFCILARCVPMLPLLCSLSFSVLLGLVAWGITNFLCAPRDVARLRRRFCSR